jgi:hypothetical protein
VISLVDLLKAGVLHCVHDMARIPACRSVGVPGVNEDGFTARWHEQGRISTFHVDHVNFKFLGGPSLGRRLRKPQDQCQTEVPKCTDGKTPPSCDLATDYNRQKWQEFAVLLTA